MTSLRGLVLYGSAPYLFRAMAIFPPTSSPRVALADLRAFLGQRSREQIIGAALSVLVTAIIVIIFFVDSKINTAPSPTIVWVENYGPERTDAEIIAEQKVASERRRKAEEARRQEFQKLEKQLGIE
ncbi:hypothetical protein [Sphingomonas xanthus]|uniref:Uncharacterized protein n=1 Tax=Sphingomonas xanthus TaxID=2594473 RepID=A0A516IRN7_9SPHN|nr:hypothetical protein [Sphingomonas xanthus]QDP19582.1 hypothetical protein FMM02_06165 [Sphingomonas xanthus]